MSSAQGQIILTEVLANEPSGRVRLEWVEIYNNSMSDYDLSQLIFIADSDTNYFVGNSIIPFGTYAVLARQLVSDDGSDSFEGYWGDSSGIWGDVELEYYPAFDITMTLSNSNGFVGLQDLNGIILDRFDWDYSAGDGRSFERDDIEDINSSWHESLDPNGSTPGHENSEPPQGGDEQFSVVVAPRTITPDNDQFMDYLVIDISIPPGSEVSAEIFDETGRVKRNLLEESPDYFNRVEWHGKDNNGSYLPPGPYIIGIFLNGQQIDSKFIPVVIAP
jgi:hypothetical protein